MTTAIRTAVLALLALLLPWGSSAAQATPRHHAADTRFMQGMIGHHAQALDMVALIAERSTSATIRTLGERIRVSQTDEIAWMKDWLTDRKEALPDPHAHHHGDHAGMPGMLSAAQMAELTAARGAAFDQLFLKYMIQHHEGALVMVAELLNTPGSVQEVATEQFAQEVASDQEMEIARMRAMLARTPDRD
jgi:uncharacterized protein (DUF305 family)